MESWLVPLKGGCVHSDMYIFHSQLINLDPLDKFCTILPSGYFIFSLFGQKQVYDTGDEAIMKKKNIRKSKLVCREKVHFLL